MPPAVHVAPEPDRAIEEAVTAAGGQIAALAQAEALIWLDSDSYSRRSCPTTCAGSSCRRRASSGGSTGSTANGSGPRPPGAYGRPVAEHALMLMLAGARRLADCARATSWQRPPLGRSTARRWRSSAPAGSAAR